MSFLGNVFNKAAGKSIPVYLTTSGPTFWRPTGTISQAAKDLAFAKTKAAFEAGSLFKDDDMKNIDSLKVTYVAVQSVSFGVMLLIQDRHMSHESEDDPNAHYSVQGEDSSGFKVNDGHVQQDESKQTVNNHLPLLCYHSADFIEQRSN